MQFIPLPSREEFTPFPDTLVERGKDKDTAIPFQHYVSRMPENKVSDTLYRAYQRLLWDIRGADFEAKVSYNIVITRDWMFISPRTRDDYIGEGFKIGINSTGMVGLLLTKSREESQFLERIGPATILAHVGRPWPAKWER
jgi:ATP adenylyltransferase/5',5'''-P-1,P-4-tetraphosphate phosphorylase II